MTTSKIRLADGRLVAGERAMPFLSGEVQFWRTPPSVWPRALDAVAELGIGLVSTYLSWRRHEPLEGEFHWGADDPSLDVRRFLQLCAERDLLVQLKPGPWICAEEIGGGYPDWLLERTDDLALGAGGRPSMGYNDPFVHPVPSMHAAGYLASARSWLRQVWDQVGDFAQPGGPVVAVQLDNEPSMAFQDALYFADYHPLAVARFRTWLAERYDGDVSAWRRAWGPGAAADFRAAEPPRPDLDDGRGIELVGPVDTTMPNSPAAVRDWLTFIEDSLLDHLSALQEIHDEAGMGHLLGTVNLIPNVIHEAPLRHRRVRERLGAAIAVGVDHYYDPPMSWELVSVLARTAASARAAGEPLVWAPELMAGIWRSPGEVVDYPDPTPAEQAAWWGAAIALGYQGFNFYMLVDRENWELAPISGDGDRTPFAAPLARLTELLHVCPDLLAAKPITTVAVAAHRPDMLDAHSTVGTMRQPVVPWADPASRVAYDAWERLVTHLVRHSVGYELWDTADLPPPRGTVVLVPEPSSVPAETLVALTAAGCCVVRVPLGEDPLAAAEVTSVVQVVDQDARSHVLAAIHFGDDGQRFLHLVQWGTSTAPDQGLLEVTLTEGTPGAWQEVLDGTPLVRQSDGRWVLPSFTGHLVYRWMPEE